MSQEMGKLSTVSNQFTPELSFFGLFSIQSVHTYYVYYYTQRHSSQSVHWICQTENRARQRYSEFFVQIDNSHLQRLKDLHALRFCRASDGNRNCRNIDAKDNARNSKGNRRRRRTIFRYLLLARGATARS